VVGQHNAARRASESISLRARKRCPRLPGFGGVSRTRPSTTKGTFTTPEEAALCYMYARQSGKCATNDSRCGKKRKREHHEHHEQHEQHEQQPMSSC